MGQDHGPSAFMTHIALWDGDDTTWAERVTRRGLPRNSPRYVRSLDDEMPATPIMPARRLGGAVTHPPEASGDERDAEAAERE